jgi:Sap, sulfolipid-1-addressing protein
MGSVFAFAFTAALNPSLLAATTLLSTLPGPRPLLVAYLIGALAISFTCGLLLVFALGATKGAGNASKHYVSPIIEILFGVSILYVVSRVARHRDHALHAWSEHRHEKQQGKPPPRWRRTLTNATPRRALIIGIILTLPGASFVAGMDELSKQHLGVAAQAGLVLLFCAIQLLIIELPLVGYFVSPDRTGAAIGRFRGFLARDGRFILLIAGAMVGLLLVARGIVRLA